MNGHHGAITPRGLDRVTDHLTESPLSQGRYGRMFRALPAYRPTDTLIDELAEVMVESEESSPDGGGWSSAQSPSALDHPTLPAGYTYFGQFIDHDLTFEPTSQLDRENDPDALRNFRTPRFDLDSLYGRGPHDQPYMYDGWALRIEDHDGTEDLPRYAHGRRALIGDPRNDENAIVAQLQLLFLKAHNKALDQVRNHCGLDGEDAFREARRVLRWHYQYLTLHDFLPRIVGLQIVQSILDPAEGDAHPRFNFRHFRPNNNAYMPLEFAVAAYRFGHSLIRPSYKLNDAHEPVPIFSLTTDDLRGFAPLDSRKRIEWKHFFDEVEGTDLQLARRIDTRLSSGLSSLPFDSGQRALARLNLVRGSSLGLPSGQSVAAAMCADRLTEEDLSDFEPATRKELVNNTPLWFHVLREAERRHNGTQLGPVGGRIVAEVFIGLMRLDPQSYLHVDPCWAPKKERSLPEAIGSAGQEFRIGHLIRWATST